jgi:hypothetical protein
MKIFKKLIFAIVQKIRTKLTSYHVKYRVQSFKVSPETWQFDIFSDSVREFLSLLRIGRFEYRHCIIKYEFKEER